MPGGRLLFVGDIHLGRRPRLDRELLDRCGLAVRDLGPAAAWRATVDEALALNVDAVVLAGDVVDHADDRFEGLLDLQQGVTRLLERGIGVYAIAGNHDGDALPWLARELPGFRLLGTGGTWEVASVSFRGGGAVHLLGWSFPGTAFASSPLAGVPQLPRGVTLGILHADLDATRSQYAPVARRELAAVPVAGWFLGHLHVPSLAPGTQPIGYLGSLTGLDSSETGPHGPWLVEVDAQGVQRLEQRPVAPLRWEKLDLALDALVAAPGDDVLAELVSRTHAAMRAADRDGGSALDRTRCVAVQVTLKGRTAARPLVRAAHPQLRATPMAQRCGARDWIVHDVRDETGAALDLAALAAGQDAPAALARLILEIEAGAPTLLARAERELAAEASRASWAVLGESTIDGRALLLRAGRDALEALLAQADRA